MRNRRGNNIRPADPALSDTGRPGTKRTGSDNWRIGDNHFKMGK